MVTNGSTRPVDGPLLVCGSASVALTHRIAAAGVHQIADRTLERFPDGEQTVRVEDVRGRDVYVVQSTGPDVAQHLVELALLLDACRRGGAARVTAVLPYYGYARQDRRGHDGEAVGAPLAAEMIAAAGADRLVVVDPHTSALEAMCRIPVEMLSAVPLLAAELRGSLGEDAVVVAPDLGAVKLAERYAALLSAPVAVVRKTRLSGLEVASHELVGDVSGRTPVLVDDMISTGATLRAAADLILQRGAHPPLRVAATHGLFVGPAWDRLGALPLAQVVVSDSLPAAEERPFPATAASLAPLLGEAILRLNSERPLGDLRWAT